MLFHSLTHINSLPRSIQFTINTFELGQHGRYRTNVWEYRGVNTLKRDRMDEIALHPTVKPVQMIADAIKDVSSRGGIVLDLFCGSGSTIIAAHNTKSRKS